MSSQHSSQRANWPDAATKIRAYSLAMIYHAGSGHPGGSLSCADMMAVLFDRGAGKEGSDQHLILSKGHACPALYAAAAVFGVLEHSEMASFRKLNGMLQGHPHVGTTPWAVTSTGSLGQGFSAAIGMALGFRHQGKADKVYAVLGDGELQEGEVWEGAMCAAHFGLGSLCAIIDYNKMQSDATNDEIMGLEPLADKWASFNWHVTEIDGHDMDAISKAIDDAHAHPDQPSVIIAHTVKGQGVDFMAGVPTWHGSVAIRTEELVTALGDLGVPEDEVPSYLDGTVWGKA